MASRFEPLTSRRPDVAAPAGERSSPGGWRPALLPVERWSTAWIVAVALLAAGIRLWHLGYANLWLDEVVGVELARQSVPAILDNVSRSPHGPAYYLLLKGWMSFAGNSAAGVRSLSAVAGVALVLIVWRMGVRLGATSGRAPSDAGSDGDVRGHGARLAILAALLAALSPVQLYFSQEARFHMVATVFVVAALAGYLRWRERAVRALAGDAAALGGRLVRPSDVLCLALPAALALYAYVLSVLPLAACWIDVGLLLLSRGPGRAARRVVAREWLMLQGVIVLCCVPLVVGRSVAAASSTQSWRTPLGAYRALTDLAYYPVHQFHSRFAWWNDLGDRWGTFTHGERWSEGPGAFLRVASFPAAFAVVLVSLAAALRSSWRTPWRAVWLASLVPLAAEAAISSRQSLELSRYALFASPPLFLLVARGLLSLPRPARVVALAALAGTMALGVHGHWRVSVRDSDYRRVASLLERAASAGDSVVVSPSYLAPMVTYHVPGLGFEVRDRTGYGWSAGSIGGRVPTAGHRWLVVDYRSDQWYHMSADSLAHSPAFGGVPLRVVLDTVLPSSIRVLKLAPVPRG